MKAVVCKSGRDEAVYVAKQVHKLTTKYGGAGSSKPHTVALLYRTGAASRVLEEALIVRGIEHKVLGG